MSVPPKKKSWAGPAAEGALVLAVVGMLFVAALAGFLVGRGSAEDNDSPAAAETQTTEETATEGATTEAATTEETVTEGGEDADGAAVFASAGCGGCHTFGPANSSGTVGPNLDEIDRSKDEIAQQVRNGGGGMPAFGDRLSDAEIDAVADYVENG
jgi:mono/diheme cytochrome c family protein